MRRNGTLSLRGKKYRNKVPREYVEKKSALKAL